jgi:hypothetical protein
MCVGRYSVGAWYRLCPAQSEHYYILSALCLKRLRREMPNQGLIEVVQLSRRILLRVSRWNDGDEGKRIGGGRFERHKSTPRQI